MDQRYTRLVEQLQTGSIDRRNFIVRAFALGISTSVIGSALRVTGAAAQDATPEAGNATIGNPDIEHITTTDKGVIRLYSSWPLTGTYELLGGDAVEAIKLALEDYGNAAGGYAIEYTALDDGIAANNGGWDPGAESANANEVIADPDAMVYMATYNSGAAKISIPIMNEAGMAQISYANTYPGLTKPGYEEGEPDQYYPSGKRNYMRTVPADDIQGAAGAKWALESKGATKAYVLHDQSLYGKGVADVFNKSFAELGGEVLGFEGYDPKAPDYQALMTKIADAGPDILYVGATVDNNAPKLMLDFRSLMPADQVTFLGPDGLVNQAFIDGSGDAAQGAFVTFAGLPPSALKEMGGPGGDYVTRMEEIVGHSPDSYATYAYETAVAVLQAIDKAGTKDRAAILDALMSTENFHSLLGGTWAFTDTGDTDSLVMSVNEIKPGADGALEIAYIEPIGA
ncbi:MAG: branched-chain amino acid ABC transporter substrate-binding protein [Thermomicrobiales bacterium]